MEVHSYNGFVDKIRVASGGHIPKGSVEVMFGVELAGGNFHPSVCLSLKEDNIRVLGESLLDFADKMDKGLTLGS